MDDVRVYNKAYSSAEILAWYQQGKYLGNDASNLLGGWRLDEVDGANAPGTGSVANNDGTINNESDDWVEGINPLGFEGLGSSLTGKAFVTFRSR